MAYNEARRKALTIVLRKQEVQQRGLQPSTPSALVPSAISTTTITDANLTNANVGDLVCIEDGNARGAWRQIKSVAATVGTFDTPLVSVTGVSAASLWKPPEMPWRTTGSGTTLTAVSSVHASVTGEANDYWIGARNYLAIFKGGANAGKAASISTFASSTGTITFSPAVTSTVTDELLDVAARILHEGDLSVSIDTKSAERMIAGYGDKNISVPLSADGKISFPIAVRPVTAAAGDATQATRPVEASDLLSDNFTETRDTGSTASGGTPMTGAALTVASASGYTVGGGALVRGMLGQIISKSGSVLTMGSGHITAASVLTGDVVYASCWYQPKETGHKSCTYDVYEGREYLKKLMGCVGTFEIEVTRDKVITMNFSYESADAIGYNRTFPVVEGTAWPVPFCERGIPTDGKGARCILGGNAITIKTLKIGGMFKLVPRPWLCGANMREGYAVVYTGVSGSMTIQADDDATASREAIIDSMRRRAILEFLYQKGKAAKEVFGIGIPCLQFDGADTADEDGIYEYSAPFHAVKPAIVSSSYDTTLAPIAFIWA
jgi:hypothetical protein